MNKQQDDNTTNGALVDEVHSLIANAHYLINEKSALEDTVTQQRAQIAALGSHITKLENIIIDLQKRLGEL